ncbi:unnamed protein product, partial [Adineta steineri]
AKKELRLESN